MTYSLPYQHQPQPPPTHPPTHPPLQVAGQCRRTRAVTGLRTVCVFGGAPKDEQAALLAGGAPPAAAGAPADEAAAAEAGAGAGGKRPHVLVATPGRLLDLADSGHLVLGHVRYVVLDEADKMLGLGFKPQLDRLYDMLQLGGTAAPAAAAAGSGAAAAAAAGSGAAAAAAVGAVEGKKKGAAAKKHKQQQAEAAEAEPAVRPQRPQVLLFSATMPAEVEAAAAQWLRKPERVAVSAGGANAISRTVTQVGVEACWGYPGHVCVHVGVGTHWECYCAHLNVRALVVQRPTLPSAPRLPTSTHITTRAVMSMSLSALLRP